MGVLKARVQSDVLWLTLNRPEKRNAIDSTLRDALLEQLDEAGPSGARCVVIQGAGINFCAGADLTSRPSGEGVAVYERMRISTQNLITALLDCPVPVIASVHGACAGFGMSVALACDLCVVADDAQFMASFLLRSIIPDGAIGYLLPRLIGLSRTKQFLFSGATMSAQQAFDLGVATAITPADKRDEVTRQLAEDLARMPTKAVSYTKAMLNCSPSIDLESYFLLERTGRAMVSTTEDAREGIVAFQEKRLARYENR